MGIVLRTALYRVLPTFDRARGMEVDESNEELIVFHNYPIVIVIALTVDVLLQKCSTLIYY